MSARAAPPDRGFDIVRVLRVIDTRQYEEGPDDRFHAIPGSGTERECDRCGRSHEIHAHVLLRSGEEATVGTGCSSGTSLELAAQFRTGTSLAKRLALLDAQEKTFKTTIADWDAANVAVQALTPPAVTATPRAGAGLFNNLELRCSNDGWALANSDKYERDPAYREERQQCTIDGWRSARMAERGVKPFRPCAPCNFERKRRAILRSMKELDKTAPAAAEQEPTPSAHRIRP